MNIKFRTAGLALCLLFSISTGYTQIHFTIESGININTIRTNLELLDYNSGVGPYFGMGGGYQFNDRLSVRAITQLSQEKYQEKVSDTGYRELRLRLHPEIEYRLLPYLGVKAGLSFSQLLRSEFRADVLDWRKVEFDGLPVERDFGLLAGLHYYFDKWQVRISYIHGTKNLSPVVLTDDNGEEVQGLTFFSRIFQLGVAYTII